MTRPDQMVQWDGRHQTFFTNDNVKRITIVLGKPQNTIEAVEGWLVLYLRNWEVAHR